MSPSVLVVEDYADLREAIASALSREKYECVCASSSEDAVVKLRDNEYSAILIAPRVPIAEDPVIHYLAENKPGEMRKVIVMSDPGTVTAGCTLLAKPFTNAAMMARIKERR